MVIPRSRVYSRRVGVWVEHVFAEQTLLAHAAGQHAHPHHRSTEGTQHRHRLRDEQLMRVGTDGDVFDPLLRPPLDLESQVDARDTCLTTRTLPAPIPSSAPISREPRSA